MRRLRDGDVEGAARVVHLVGGACRGLGLDRRPHPPEIRVGTTARGEPCDLRLESEARLEPLAHVVEPDLRHEEPPVDLELDEAVAGEPAQRLTHRAAGDAEPVCQIALREPRTGSE